MDRYDETTPENIEEVVIIGSGPAGLTAALYAARADLKPIVITGDALGGQLGTTSEVENYPGAAKEHLTGPELIDDMRSQAERFGARLVYDSVTEVDFTGPFHRVKTFGEEYWAKSVIVTTGASPRKLGVPGEEQYTGYGVSYCATCDGFFFRDKEVIVVGGGDSALEEGLFLTKFAKRVRVIHRRDELRAGQLLQSRAAANEKMSFIWNTVVTAIEGEDGAVTRVLIENRVTGETDVLEADGVFIYIGHYPNSALFDGILEMDEHGYVLTDERKRTGIAGIFAAGEINDPIFRQAITSAGEGCKAAMQCEKYLSELGAVPEPGGRGRSLASW
ncbi:MAG: thioredoxin-disulfide reductase [Anaerolineales bacterium]|nr:thioredoxin-disulfide reductase [Anaerolineales bacterium]